MQKIKRIVAWIALVAVMLSSFAFAEDVLPVDDHEHTEIEQVVEAVEAEEPAAEEDEAAAEEAAEEATEEEIPAEEASAAEEIPAEEEAPAEEEIPAEEELPVEEEAGIALLSLDDHECWMSCERPGECYECGAPLDNEEWNYGHDGWVEGYDDWPCYDIGNGMHANKCNRCDKYFGFGEHWNSCLTPGKCGDCGAEVEIDWAEGHDGYVEEYDDWHRYDLGNGTCGFLCNRCGEYFDVDGHWNSCATPGFCGGCGAALNSDEYEICHDSYSEEKDRNIWVDLGNGMHAEECQRCGTTYNEGEHWALCTADGKCGDCGAELDPEEYGEGHNMVCSKPGVCEHCGCDLDLEEWNYGHDGHDDDYGGWRGYDLGDGTHNFKCRWCGEYFGIEGHWPDCTKGGRCGACDAELDPNDYGEGHWMICTDPGVCQNCGCELDSEDYNYGHDGHDDDYGGWRGYDLGDGTHTYKCQYCGEYFGQDDHDGYDEEFGDWRGYDLGDGTHNFKCGYCGVYFGAEKHGVSCDNPDKSACQSCGASLEGLEEGVDYDIWHDTWNEELDNDWVENPENPDECGTWCKNCEQWIELYEHNKACWNDGKCDRCQKELPEDWEIGHNCWIEEEEREWCIDLGDGTHGYKCIDCGEFFDTGLHAVLCTDEDKTKCRYCGVSFEGWKEDDDYWVWHWFWDDEDNENWHDVGNGKHAETCYRCGNTYNATEHWVSCANPTVCADCGAAVNPEECENIEHNYYNEEIDNWNWIDLGDGNHGWKCVDCGEIDNVFRHCVTCADLALGKCNPCGASLEGLTADVDFDVNHHIWDDENERKNWIDLGDGTHALKCLDCGLVVETGTHFAYVWAEDKTTCALCGAKGENLELTCEHEWSDAIYCEDRPGYHAYYCTLCSEVITLETCYLRCNNTNAGVCEACGAEVGSDVEIAHSGLGAAIDNGELYSDASGHWWTCTTCGEVLKAEHNSDCEAEDLNVCIYCGYESSEELPKLHGWINENGFCTCCGEQVLACNEFEPTFVPLDNMPGYHAVICANCGELRDIVKCSGMCTQKGDEIGTCAECGAKLSADAEIEHSRQGEWEWQYDANSHWYTCNACGKTEKAPHRVLCNNPSVCVFCGYEGCANPTVVHDLVSGDEAGYCGRCGKHITHYASCKNPAVCAECGEAYTGTDVRHNYNVEQYAGEAIPGNPDYCGYRCLDCGLWDSVEKHCVSCDSTDKRCVNCGTIVANPEINHQVDWETVGYDKDSHWATCVVCGKEVKEPHYNWCDTKNSCALGCENVNVSNIVWHVTGIDYTAAPTQLPNDETKHGWYCAACGDYAAVAEHNYVNGVCICGASLGVTAVIVPEEMTMAVKQVESLIALVEGKAEKFEYASSKTSVATIDANGVITAKKAGTAKITVTATGADGVSVSAEMKLTVKKTPTKIALASKTLSMGVGETTAIKTTLSPSGAYSTLTWESSDESVVFVDSEGTITAKAEGTAKIRVSTFNGMTATCTVTVLGAPATLNVNADELSLIVKKTYTLKTEVKSEMGGACAGTLTFESSDPSVATVDAKGKITAKKIGEATITVSTYNGLTRQVKVGVFNAPSKVSLDVTKVSLNRGETLQLNAIIAENCYATFSWSTSSKKVATVDANGLVTAIAEGSATITVKTNNGKKATAKITVVDPYKPTGIALDQTGTITIDIGEELQLNATLKPATAQSELKWSSSSKKVATVDENGVVTGVKAGTATITVQTHNGKKATVKVKVVKNKAFEPYKGTWKIKNATYGGITLSAKDVGLSGMKVTASDTGVTMKIGKDSAKLDWRIEDGSLVLEDEVGDSVVCTVVSKNKMSLVFNFDDMEGMVFWFTK